MSSKKTEAAPPARAVTAPGGWKGTPGERLGKENNQCVATHRSLEGLGYLGMLSATPTDIGLACFKRPMSGSEKPFCYYPRLARGSYDEEAPVGKS